MEKFGRGITLSGRFGMGKNMPMLAGTFKRIL